MGSGSGQVEDHWSKKPFFLVTNPSDAKLGTTWGRELLYSGTAMVHLFVMGIHQVNLGQVSERIVCSTINLRHSCFLDLILTEDCFALHVFF